MLNLFRSKKDPSKSTSKSSRKGQASNRTGSRTAQQQQNGETRSWFGGRPTKPVKTSSNIKDIQIRPISASSPALNNNNNERKRGGKRPLTVVEYSNVTLRRGQQTSKIESQTPEDLSRSSSVTNLNAEQKSLAKGAKPKKSDSKDRLDKVSKHENKNKTNKNNNKESSDNNGPDSLIDVEELQRQLMQMANDKSNLALQLGEQTGHLNKLQNEIAQLKMMHEESNQKIELLMDENTVLRNRLRDVAHSPLSDTEKQQLLYESHRHSSAPASIATNLVDDGGDITTCPTPEWDKHSSSNVSEVSVACLQDKINQMQETHYSTNEELQATLQELTDLQRQLTELQQENLRLNDEKNLMFESLCRQTERLNDSRSEVENLKQLLYKDENGQFETAAEREQKLVDLLKSAQEEREGLLMKQEQMSSELEDSRGASLIQDEQIGQLSERVKTLESTLDAKHAEHKLLDQELAQAKDQSSSRQIEINRLKDLLENARTKIIELEQDRALSDKSELDELLDNARKEKDALESEVAHLKEQLALSKNEIEKLKEQVSILQEECKVTRNNAKTTQSDLEYKLEKVLSEKSALSEQLQQFQEAVNELQVQAQCQLDDKRQLSAVLSETQRNLNESERRVVDLENELSELKKTKQEQEEEWEKFQNDLLTSVRVANDFKTEAQQDLQKLIMENKAGRERIKQLETQIEKMKGGSKRKPTPKKRLSNEETLMASLNRRYKEIEHLTEQELTEEQKAVKVLKEHYDRDLPRQKPVAHKPKDKLAISKPSLESVISNPKLEKIVSDAHLQNVEASNCYFSDDERNRTSLSPTRFSLLDSIGSPVDELDACKRKNSYSKSEMGFPVTLLEERREIVRSKSLTDLPEAAAEEQNLRRYDSTENLLSISTKERKKRKKSSVSLETLDKICQNIEPNTPEDKLTKEQQLALRLKEFLSREGRKSTLKRNPKLLRKKVDISRPTKESVERNTKLRQIINDPIIRNVGPETSKVVKRIKSKGLKKKQDRHSMPVSPKVIANEDSLKKGSKKSKSYNDITFKFQMPNMYSEEEEDGDKKSNDAAILPPEEFRDIPSSMMKDNSAFRTFQYETNTFKKEHNYLDDHSKVEVDQQGDDQNVAEEPKSMVLGRNLDDEIDYGAPIPKERNIEEDIEYYSAVDDEDFADAKDDNSHVGDEKINETLNDVVTRRLEYEDELLYDLDEEEKIERRGTRQRYSRVIVEMKGKFGNSSEGDTEDEEKDTKSESEDLVGNLPLKALPNAPIFDVTKRYDIDNDQEVEDLVDEEQMVPEDKQKGDILISKTIDQDLDVFDLLADDIDQFRRFRKRAEKDKHFDSEVVLNSEDIVDSSNTKEEDIAYTTEEPKHLERVELKRESSIWEDSPSNFTNDEIELLEHYSRRRPSRPLSEIKPEDLALVDGLKEYYLNHEKGKSDQDTERDVTDDANNVKIDDKSYKFDEIADTEETKSDSKDIVLNYTILEDIDKYEISRIYHMSEDTSYVKYTEGVISDDNVVEDVNKHEPGRLEGTKDNYDVIDAKVDYPKYLEDRFDDIPKIVEESGFDKIKDTADSKYKEGVKTIDSVAEDIIKFEFDTDDNITEDTNNSNYKHLEDVKTYHITTEDTGKDKFDEIKETRAFHDSQGHLKHTEDTKTTCDVIEDGSSIEGVKETKIDSSHLRDVAAVEGDTESHPKQIEDVKTKNVITEDTGDDTFDETEDIKVSDVKTDNKVDKMEDTKADDSVIEDTRSNSRNSDDVKSMKETVEASDKSRGEPTGVIEDTRSNSRNSEDVKSMEDDVQASGRNLQDSSLHTFPRILPPAKLHRAETYEPVYANFFVATNRKSSDLPVTSGKKPIALPRNTSLDASESFYRDFGGQVRRTRFSINYDRKKGDSFKQRNQEKSAKVKDLKEMFERRSRTDFTRLVDRALEDN